MSTIQDLERALDELDGVIHRHGFAFAGFTQAEINRHNTRIEQLQTRRGDLQRQLAEARSRSRDSQLYAEEQAARRPPIIYGSSVNINTHRLATKASAQVAPSGHRHSYDPYPEPPEAA